MNRFKVKTYNYFTAQYEWRERRFFSPFRCPRWARIAFFVTLPVSGTLWAAALLICGILVVALGCIVIPITLLVEFGVDLFERDAPLPSSEERDG